MTELVTLKFRRGTTSEWTATSSKLAAGEPGFDITTGNLKIGDGTSMWADLPTFQPGDGSSISANGASVVCDDPAGSGSITLTTTASSGSALGNITLDATAASDGGYVYVNTHDDFNVTAGAGAVISTGKTQSLFDNTSEGGPGGQISFTSSDSANPAALTVGGPPASIGLYVSNTQLLFNNAVVGAGTFTLTKTSNSAAIINSPTSVTLPRVSGVRSAETFNTKDQGLYFSFTLPALSDSTNELGISLNESGVNKSHSFQIIATNKLKPLYVVSGVVTSGTTVSYTPGQSARMYFNGSTVTYYLDSTVIFSCPIITTTVLLGIGNNTNTTTTLNNIQCYAFTPGTDGATGRDGVDGFTGITLSDIPGDSILLSDGSGGITGFPEFTFNSTRGLDVVGSFRLTSSAGGTYGVFEVDELGQLLFTSFSPANVIVIGPVPIVVSKGEGGGTYATEY